MKSAFTAFFAIVIIALAATAADAGTLTMKIECDQVGAGEQYDVRIYAMVEDTGPGKGLADTQFTITSPDSTGVTRPVEKSPPPHSGKVSMAWTNRIGQNFGSKLDALYQDADADGDEDAFLAAFADLGNWNDQDVGLGDWTLLATQTWEMLADERVRLEIEVGPTSRYFDLDLNADPYKSEFGAGFVFGIGASAGQPVPEPGTIAMLLSLLGIAPLWVWYRKRRSA